MKSVVPGSDASSVIRIHSRQSEKADFSNAFKIAEVNTLLRASPHYSRWKTICQNNITSAEKLAEIILERNDLQEKAENGQTIDWIHFDSLTDLIQHNGIFMLKSDELINQGIVTPLPSAKKLTEPVPNSTPSFIFAAEKNEEKKPHQIIPFPAERSPSNSIKLIEDNFLIFDMKYGRKILNQGIIGYGNQEKVLLALNDITHTLDFNIDVDAKKGRAWGWFISDDNRFELDVPGSELIINGKRHAFSNDQVAVGKNDIYVDSQALSEWFPVDFNIVFSDLTVNINPRKKLIFQEKIDRQQKRESLDKQASHLTQLPYAASEYRLAAVPFMDVHLESRYTSNEAEPHHHSRYSILSKGDLLNMTAGVFMAGDSEDHLNKLSIAMEKNDPENRLLGGLKASRYAFGDINPSCFPIHTSYPMERGGIVEKGDIERTSFFDKTLFQGNLQPGWEVEVYRNERLIASTIVGEDGRYRFDEVPVYYGDNDFKLVFYGPQGQRKEETKRITIGDDMIRKGESAYQFSVTQQNTPMFDVRGDNIETTDDSARVTANFERGIRDNLAFNTSVSSFEINGDRHEYVNFGLKGTAGRIAAKADAVHDLTGGDAFQSVIQTGFGPVRIRAEHDLYSDFVEEQTAGSADPLKSATNIRAQGFVGASPVLSQFQYGLTYDHTDSEYSHDTTYNADLYLAKYFRKFYLSNNLFARWTDMETSSDIDVDGSFRVSGSTGSNFIRGKLNYDVSPDPKFTSLDFMNRWYINSDLSLKLNYIQYLKSKAGKEGSVSLSWDAGNFLLTPSISYNSDGIFKAFVGLDFSFAQEPRTRRFERSSKPLADSGAVSAFVFQDKNANHIFDDGDQPVRNAKINAVQFGKNVKTDENGVAFITRLPKFNATDVKIQTETLEDPFWQATTDGNSIRPPPGNVHHIDFPIISTGEVDGTIYGVTPEGEKIPLKNVRIKLVDDEGNVVQTLESEYDGFYLFTKLPPGTYSLIPDDIDKRPVQFLSGQTITIAPEGNVVSGMDIVLGGLEIYKKTDYTELSAEELYVHNDISKLVLPEDKFPTLKTDYTGLSPKELYVHNDISKLVLPEDTFPALKTDYTGLSAEELYVHNDIPKLVLPEDKFPALDIEKKQAEVPKEIVPVQQKKGTSAHKNKLGFGVHLSSYRTEEKAIAGIDYVKKKYKNLLTQSDFTIRRVDLGPEKGIWYRVFAGPFDNKDDADQLCSKLKRLKPYTRVLSIQSERKIGLHLSSYRSNEKAAAGIRWLQGKLKGVFDESDFYIKKVDLGPEKGVWYRVIAGSFNNKEDAVMICDQIKSTQPWCNGYPIENRSKFGVHMESYRTNSSASKGIEALTKKYKKALGESDFIIRRVDLGPEKGIWYRVVAGSFDTKQAADTFALRLKSVEPYCKTCEITVPLDHKKDTNKLQRKQNRPKPYTSVLPIQNDGKIGLHLSSYRSNERAAEGIRWLQEKLKGVFDESDFYIKKIKLGLDKGIWYRVIAGSFESKEEAAMICDRIKSTQPWCKGYPVENRSKFGVHMESYRTNSRASKGIELLAKKYKKLLGESDFIIKRVDLGPEKGIWYRVIVGSFSTKQAADTMALRLKHYD